MLIKQSSSAKVIPFFMVDSSDHITGKLGLSPTVLIAKNGAAFISPTGAVSEIGNGWYKIAGNTTDSNTLGSLLVHATAAGADPFDDRHEVVVFDMDDIVRLGLTSLPNAVAEAAGGLYTRGSGAGQINQPANGLVDINVERWNATLVPAEHTAGYPVVTVKDGTGTGEIDTTSGGVLVSSFAAAAIQSIWDALTSGFVTVGSIGKRLVDYITGDTFARVGAPVGASISVDIANVKSETATIKSKTDQLNFTGTDVKATLDGELVVLTAAYDAAKTAAQAGDAMALTGAERSATSDVVWDEAIAGHLAAGSTGAALNAAGAAGDPWNTGLPGTYGAGTAGYLLSNLSGDVWNELRSEHTLPGSTGEAINAILAVSFANNAPSEDITAQNMTKTFEFVAGGLNLIGTVGNDLRMDVIFPNKSLVGYTFEGYVILEPSPLEKRATLTITAVDLPQGQIKVSLTDTETSAIGPVANKPWFVKWDDGAGEQRNILMGRFQLNRF